jgi:hypothetical protein
MNRRTEPPKIEAVLPLAKEQAMRPYLFIVRISILASLVLASVLGGGWKWGRLPH